MHQEIGISSLETCLRIRLLRWFGHIERQPADAWPKLLGILLYLAQPREDAQRNDGKIVSMSTEVEVEVLKLKKENAMERDKWRRLIRSQPKASNPQG